jgi:hypothetical protein
MMESETVASQRLHKKSSTLRFGVMCNGSVFQRWQADALNDLKEHGHQIVLLIRDPGKEITGSTFRRLLKKKPGTLLYTFLENRIFKPALKQSLDLQRELEGIEVLNCIIEQKGYSAYFQDSDIETIRSYNLDFILRFGFSIIRGDILTAARFGIWSFHHDDEMRYRGGPPGFWEIFKNDPVSGAVMQRLTEKLDGGIILKKGYLKTIMHSYRENLNQLLAVSYEWPAMVADELAARSRDADIKPTCPDFPASTTTAPVCRLPGNTQMLRFLFLLLQNRLRFYYRELLSAEIWNVGIIPKPIHEIALGGGKLVNEEITWFPVKSGSDYLADPAGFIQEGRLHVLAEDFSYARQKAIITAFVMETEPFNTVNPVVKNWRVGAMEADSHHSYPYVFKHENKIYCLPESYRSSRITLYRQDQSSGLFMEDRILLNNVRAVDPTMIFYNEMWWLFFTDRTYSNTMLFLYYARELTGEFLPHRKNPVKTDIRSARPAGTPFVYDNALYRPAQDCSATYGGRVAINRVSLLTVDDFAEETINFIEPVQGSGYAHGLHTISGVGNYTLIDGKKYHFNHFYAWHQLWKKLSGKGSEDV